MDNAKYHNVLSDDTFPTPRSKKDDLRLWLKNNQPDLVDIDDMLKPELYEICKKNAPLPEYKLDKIAKKHGHSILRTPQYHCELQPIENCWGVVKNYCANNCNFTMKGLKKQLKIGFSKVTKKTCMSVVKKMKEREDLFWKEDSLFEEKLISTETDYCEDPHAVPEDYDLEIE